MVMTNGAAPGGAPAGSHAAGPSVGSMPRRSSYASVVSGAAPQNYTSPARAGAFSHFATTTPSNSYPPQYQADYRYSRQYAGQESEMAANGSVPFGSTWRKSTSLPSYSRQFAHLPGHSTNGLGPVSSFFTPSYLRKSRYVTKLEAAHRNKLLAQRETASPHSSNPPSLSTSSSNLNLHRMAPSHRGMTYDIIEHPHQGDEENLMPLPSKWSDVEKNPGLDVLGDGLEVRYNGPSSKTDMDAAAARSDYPMTPQCGMYYFEVEIKDKSKDGMIAVGFSSQKANLDRLPGWETESWAYHGDDGKIFCGESTGKNYGPTFTKGDIIGCGINFWTGCAFFTRNGVDLGIAFRELKTVRPFPSVGMKKHPGAWVGANFGQKPFIFDIDGMMAREHMKVAEEINATEVKFLHPPLDEDLLLQELVAHFLAHDGYVETAKAFASEVKAESVALQQKQSASLKEVEADDDFDAINRQSKCVLIPFMAVTDPVVGIRAAILEGDIDKALKITNKHYRGVLEENPLILFRLKCRKFVELIRRCSEIQTMQAEKASKSTNGHSRTSHIDVFEQDMELDDQITEGDEWERMDTEEEAESTMRYAEILEEAMGYGQQLRQEYRDEGKEYKKPLDEVFSLIAYDDAKASVYGHLLDPKGRVTVAEELNSAILGTLARLKPRL